MTAGLARTCIALMALGAGTAVGCQHEARWWSLMLLGAPLLMTRVPTLRLLALAASLFAAGTLNGNTRCDPPSAIRELAVRAPRCILSGRVLERAGGLGTLVAVDRARCESYRPMVRPGTVIVDDEGLEAGALFSGRGSLAPLTDDSFDMARRRLGAGAFFDVDAATTGRPRGVLLSAAHSFRHSLESATRVVGPNDAALLRGLTIGDTSAMAEADLDDLRRAGLSHLVAVSGENVAIVLAALGVASHRLGLATRVAVGVAGIVLFVAVVGPEPSVLRAAVMGSIGLAALALGRSTEPLHVLGLAAIILIAARPALVFSVGLHLSAAATAGIVLWAAPLARRVERFVPRLIAVPLGVTLAAQIAVAPILAAAFGQLSVVAPAANLLAVTAVPPATIAGLSAGLAGVAWLPAGAAAARIAAPFASFILWVGRVFGRLSWAAVDVPRGLAWPMGVAVVLLAVVSIARTSATGRVIAMVDWRWVLLDASGNELRSTEAFSTKEQAEAWMGEQWSALLAEGAESVALRSDGATAYTMGLRAE